MSLIESALARARAIAGTREGTRSTSQSPSAKPQPKIPPSPVAVPTERIPSTALQVDRKTCLESRVLLDETRSDKSAAAAAASYRMLRTRLLRRARTNGWTSIGITSAAPNDGKSLTALNLGISLAREGNSEVVLLDLDMRNPSMCRYLGVNPPGQLRDYFERRASPSEMFFSIGLDNLLLASATVSTDRASELLATSETEGLIQYVKQRTANPIILIDLPPVLVTDDALVVAPKVDALLIVAAEGHTSRAALTKAMGMLAEFPIAGLVLNRAVETAPNYGYGYAYDSPVD